MTCEACGKVCGPLRGRAKSWRCAGVLSHRAREARDKRSTLRAKFDNPDKQGSREVLREEVMALPEGARVLDLYGGGLSAEWFLSLRPDLRLTVAEIDRALWPAMREDAKRIGFTPVFGDFAKAEGKFAFVWLDLCGEPMTAMDATSRVIPLLYSKPKPLDNFSRAYGPHRGTSALYVTVMDQDRQGYRQLRREVRDIATKALLGHAADVLPTDVEVVHRYRQAGGKGEAVIWRVGTSIAAQRDLLRVREAEHLRDATFHRGHAEATYAALEAAVVTGDTRASLGTKSSHAEGTCKCWERGFISREEWETNQQRFNDLWSRWNKYPINVPDILAAAHQEVAA